MTGVRADIEEKLANSSQNDDPREIAAMRTKLALLPTSSPGTTSPRTER